MIDTQTLSSFTSTPSFDGHMCHTNSADWPRITIVTPSYNQAAYIEHTILSVLNQNYPNLEYFILDGGSADGSVDIIRKYERYCTYWRSYHDGGQSEAVAEGFNRATGEIFAWINSDDVYLPNVLRLVGEVMREDPHTDICYGNMLILDPTAKIVAERRVVDCPPSLIRLGFRYGGFGIYQPASFWRRALYEAVGGLNPSLSFCMDNDLFIRFVLHGAKFRFVHAPLYGFRVHPDSKTTVQRKVAEEEFARLAKQYDLDWTSPKARCLQTAIRLYRAGKHCLQGDALYLAKRLFPDRWSWVP
jgi:glycosyltransferase involved in cell wall biosynthesis